VATGRESRATLLESVLGATPQEFESPILRHRDQAQRWSSPKVGLCTILRSLPPVSLIQLMRRAAHHAAMASSATAAATKIPVSMPCIGQNRLSGW